MKLILLTGAVLLACAGDASAAKLQNKALLGAWCIMAAEPNAQGPEIYYPLGLGEECRDGILRIKPDRYEEVESSCRYTEVKTTMVRFSGDFPSVIEYMRAGRLRALAVTTATRSEALPDIPTVGEFLPGYKGGIWYGLGAPKATPAEIVNKLNKEVNAALDDPKMKARLADLGGTALPGSPADFGKHIAEETEKWGKVIRAANIKPE